MHWSLLIDSIAQYSLVNNSDNSCFVSSMWIESFYNLDKMSGSSSWAMHSYCLASSIVSFMGDLKKIIVLVKRAYRSLLLVCTCLPYTFWKALQGDSVLSYSTKMTFQQLGREMDYQFTQDILCPKALPPWALQTTWGWNFPGVSMERRGLWNNSGCCRSLFK